MIRVNSSPCKIALIQSGGKEAFGWSVGMSNILDIDEFNRSFPVEWTHRILVGTAEMGSELVFEIVK